MITKSTSPGYLYAVTTDSTCLITDVDTRYNLCKAVVNKQGMFVAIGGSVECSDDNVLLTQASTTSGGTRFEVVTTRPEIGETGVIYLVPASNSTTENLYEEWVWVDDKWEQIGSAGLNLSNYAQLTTANTFSAANTFNGNLIKKTSTTALADNSVLNRSEMDSRYGKLSGGNSWTGEQNVNGTLVSAGIRTSNMIALEGNGTVGLSAMKPITIGADLVATRDAEIKGKLKVYSSDGICIHATSGVLELNRLDSWKDTNGQKNSCIQVLANLHLGNNKVVGVHTGTIRDLYVDKLSAIDSLIVVNSGLHMNNSNITHANQIEAKGMYLSGGATMMGTLVTTDIRTVRNSLTIKTPSGHTEFVHDVNIRSSVSIVGQLGLVGSLSAGSEKTNIDVQANLHMQGKDIKYVSNISSPNGVSLGIKSDIHAYGNNISEVDKVSLAKLEASSLSNIPSGIAVLSSLHFKPATGSYVNPDILIANEELRAVALPLIPGEDRYGIRVTNTSCQLFGIDFNYGDVWSETNDRIKAQGATPMPGLDSASYFDTVKIIKPAVSIATTGIGSLSFDYATEAYIRTFPDNGGQGIFEFQAGNWTDSNANFIKRGPVDLRKASATTLGPTSVLNMEEGDARWGGGGSTNDVAVEALVPTNFNPPVSAEVLDPGNIGNQGAYGIAIGPNATANIYRDIAIGGWIDTSNGKGDNTILGYGFSLGSGASNVLAIGQGNNTVIESNNTVFIGKTVSTNMRSNNSVSIKGTVNGHSVVAINGTAGDLAVAVGAYSIADTSAVAVGEGTVAGVGGTALGAYSVAGRNMLTLQAGIVPAISMQLYSGTSWEDRNETGYLRFVTAKLRENIDNPSASNREEITINKKTLWDAIQRANDYNYPAQPYEVVTDVQTWSQILKQNTIYALDNSDDLNLESLTFDNTISGIPTAELWITLSNDYAPPTVAWPVQMLWPDETNTTIAPTLDMPAEGYNRTYCITIRKHKIGTNDLGFVASVAYHIDTAV